MKAMNKLLLLLLPLLLLLGGCATGWPPQTLPTVEEMSVSWQQGEKPIKMLGEMTLTLPSSQYSAEHTLLIAPGGQFRLDVSGPFAKRVFTIVCDGANMLALFYDDNRAYYGRATPQNLARFMGMELNPRRVYAVLGAQAPFWASGQDLALGRVIASSNPGEILLLMPAEQSITFKLATMQVLEASLREDNGEMLHIIYRWRGLEHSLPLSMELAAPDGRALNLYNDSSVYVEFNPADFRLPQAPAGMDFYYMTD